MKKRIYGIDGIQWLLSIGFAGMLGCGQPPYQGVWVGFDAIQPSCGVVSKAVPATTAQCQCGGTVIISAEDVSCLGAWSPNDPNQQETVICKKCRDWS